jgi:hypothetical protein
MRIGGIIVVIWLVIGALAGFQRGYYSGDEKDCGEAGTIALTVVAGPLNYVGLNPKVEDCETPQPSE